MTDEKTDAADAAKPGESTTAAQPTTEAALEAGSQNIPAEGRRQIEVVDVRRGMFGASGSGDTSGYGGLVTAIALPGPSDRPYGGWFDEVVDILAEVLDESGTTYAAAVESVVVDREELTLHVAREHLVEVAQVLRDDQDLRFELSLGVSGVHYPHDAGRELHAVYHLVSVTHSRRLRLEVAVPDSDPHLPSTVGVYPANDWHERETYDFFGMIFDGHPALARIEMPDDWPGHPQRKDYPLGGIPVEYKGATIPPPDQRRSYR
ncbi:NADH-quinone oxidoreductase subunit C [Cellulomonas sp. P5_C5]